MRSEHERWIFRKREEMTRNCCQASLKSQIFRNKMQELLTTFSLNITLLSINYDETQKVYINTHQIKSSR